MCPLVVINTWLLFAYQWEELILRLIGCENWPVIIVKLLFQRLTIWSRIYFSKAVVPD